MTLADGVSNRWWVNEEVKNRSLGKKKNGGLALKELPRQASPPRLSLHSATTQPSLLSSFTFALHLPHFPPSLIRDHVVRSFYLNHIMIDQLPFVSFAYHGSIGVPSTLRHGRR